MAAPFLKCGPVGSATILIGITWSAPVHSTPGTNPVPWAIDLPTACSTVTLATMMCHPLGQDVVTVRPTSSFAVTVAAGATLILTPLSARATVADETARITSTGSTSAKRANLDTGLLLSSTD